MRVFLLRRGGNGRRVATRKRKAGAVSLLHPEEFDRENRCVLVSLSSLCFTSLSLSLLTFHFSTREENSLQGSGESSSLSLSLSLFLPLTLSLLSPFPSRQRLPFCSGPLEEATEKEESSEETQSKSMAALKSRPAAAALAWSPLGPYLAAGSAAGAIDVTFSSASSLEVGSFP